MSISSVVILNPLMDRVHPGSNNNRCKETVNLIMDQHDLCDAWRLKNPNSRVYTWKKDKNSQKVSRLDYFLISQSLLSKVSSCKINSNYGYSDHSMITLSLTHNVHRGPGYWKFNAKHLRNLEFVNHMNDVIENLLTVSEALQPDERWGFVKLEIANQSKIFSINYAKNRQDRLNEIELRIDRLQSQLDELPYPHPQAGINLQNLCHEYQSYVDEKV